MEGRKAERHEAEPHGSDTGEETHDFHHFVGRTTGETLQQGIHFSFTAVP